MESTYLHRTHYLNHYTNWVKTIVTLLALIMVGLAWIFADDEYDSMWIVLPVIMLICLGILFSPVDDLAISQHEFFHLKTSFLKFLNKSEAFNIATISSINAVTNNNNVNDASKYETVIQMRLKDGSLKSFKVTMMKKDIEEYLERVRQMITIN